MKNYFPVTTGLLLALAQIGRGQTASISGRAPASTGVAAQGNTPAAPAILLAAEEMPTFPGGPEGFLKFLTGYLKYPEEALEYRISGRVYVTFVVDDQGRVRDPHVVKGLGHGLDEEAVRLVRLMPWWTPGRHQGAPVWVQLTLSITFRAL